MSDKDQKYRSIDDYHASQPAEFREILEQFRGAIVEAVPEAIETISYGMPAFRQNKILVYYALYKSHIGLYPTPNAIVHFKNELLGYKTSKGAIQFRIDKPMPVTLIQRIVKFRLDEDSQAVQTAIEVLPGVLHELPEDLKTALITDRVALERWNTLTPIQRNEWICWVTIVKKPETRAEHTQRMLKELKEGKRQPCCWPGCPHRRPSAQKWFNNIEE